MDKKQLIKNGNYFILIGSEDDKRLALRLSEQPDMELVPKYPELVDIKLTDVCHIGCAWCYQDSTSNSKHGNTELIKTVIKSLPVWIEVAFGGGDVLQHPDIVEILTFARNNGLTSSNVTMNWQSIMRYPDKVKEVMPLLDAIGVSITGKGQIQKVIEKLQELDCYRPSRICFHIIPDLYSKDLLIKILNEVAENAPQSDVLFLGYKTNGRGHLVKTKPKHTDDMREIVNYIIEKNINLQCDTKFIQDYLDVIEEVSSPLTYDIKEGEYSMNIDCVENFYSIASYNLSHTWEINDNFDIVEAFANVRKAGGMSIYGQN